MTDGRHISVSHFIPIFLPTLLLFFVGLSLFILLLLVHLCSCCQQQQTNNNMLRLRNHVLVVTRKALMKQDRSGRVVPPGRYLGGRRSYRCYYHTTTNLRQEPFYGSPRPITPPLSIHNTADRWQLLLQHATTALRDPTRADAVAAVGELTGTTAIQQLQKVMRAHPVGQQILLERPVVRKDRIPYESLLQQAQEIKDKCPGIEYKDMVQNHSNSMTFGQAYGLFLLEHGYDPDGRDDIHYMSRTTPDEDELAYIMLRYRQSHDFWHALTGLPPTVLGELALKWLELFQTGMPLAAFSATIGSLITLPAQEQVVLRQHYLPWALRVGRTMPFGSLMTVYYEKEWDTPLVELQQRLKVEPAPPLVS
jgi:ubiquinone biosynthesis protein COQ4